MLFGFETLTLTKRQRGRGSEGFRPRVNGSDGIKDEFIRRADPVGLFGEKVKRDEAEMVWSCM